MFKIKWTEYLSFIVTFGVGIYSFYISKTDLEYFDSTLSSNGGLLEWLTFIGLCAISFSYFYRLKVLSKFRNPKFNRMLLGLGVFFSICALEEVSWGQRVFGWQSPKVFTYHAGNLLETNFQNLFIALGLKHQTWNIILRSLLFIYMIVMPFAYLNIEKVKQRVDEYALPVPKATHIITFGILLVLALLIPSDNNVQFAEFSLTWVLTALTLEPYNRPMFSRRSLVR